MNSTVLNLESKSNRQNSLQIIYENLFLIYFASKLNEY